MTKVFGIGVISDSYLRTNGGHAEELLCYLKQIEPPRLILNGYIFDAWQFGKKYFSAMLWKGIERIPI